MRCERYSVRRLSCHACFFFFQAEDGIRDLTVAGVQTCALPISKSPLIALAAALTLAAPAAAQVKLNGAGATFPNIIYQDWMLTYNKTHPDVQLNYQSIGSGGGIRQFSDGTVDFGADRKSTRLNS